MPHFPHLRLCLVIALSSFAGIVQAESNVSDAVTLTDLRCEYLVDPLGLDVAKPRLSWVLTSTHRGEMQKAYQVLVASTKELLDKDQGDLWDSGKAASNESTFIDYSGSALVSREACWWKVRVWDAKGNPSAWSTAASWEMGLLKPDDWQAKWIAAPKIIEALKAEPGPVAIVHATYEAVGGTASKDVTDLVAKALQNNTLSVPVNNKALGGDPALNHTKQLRVDYTIGDAKHESVSPEDTTLTIPEGRRSFPYLRKDFSLDKPIAKARLYATALGIYELHLNGQRVGDHLFAPDWTDYSKRSRYQDYDVTALVKSGANTLGAMVGNGWYCGKIGNGGFQAWGKVPAFFAQLEVTYADGSVARIVTDASWKKHGGPITNADNMLGEDYDAQKEIAGWDQPGLDVSDWVAVEERAETARPLDGQVSQAVRQIGERKPQSMKEATPGHWVFDLGQNMVGFVRLKVNEPAGTVLTLHHAEMLNADGTMYTTNLRGAPSVDSYVCKGGGEETWQPHFTFHGFRYVGLAGLTGKPTDSTVTGIVVGTDIPHTGDFSTSNADINQLQSNIQWGMRGNYLSVPTDCPQRDERMGWMGDAQVFIRTATYNGDVAAFFTKWLVDVDDAQTPEGGFTDVVPNPPANHGGHERGGTPAWGDAGVICPWTIYLMYGDKRILQQHLPAMTKWIEYCRTNSTDLIRDKGRGADYGDWLSQGEGGPKEMIGTAFFAYTTSLVAKAYEVTGDAANAAKYSQLADQVKAAFDKKYVSADGHLEGGTQCAYVMALRFNLLPDDLRPKAAQYLADNVKAHHDHLTTGFVGVSYLLPALTAQHQTDTAYKLFLQDTFPSWLFSVKQGATTIWERWDGWTPEKGFQNPGMNSFNHYSLGSCGEWMFDTVAGIGVDPAQPGFKHIIIRPIPGGNLTHAEGTFDSIHGKIVSKWKVEKGEFSLDVTIPPNTTASVELPTTNLASVKEGGQGVANNPDVKSAQSDHGTTEYQIGSGDYHFSCAMP